jgi:hypothetical protein
MIMLSYIRNELTRLNGSFLVFLVLFLNVKVYVKVAVLLFFLLWLSRKLEVRIFFRQRYSWFYLLVLAMTIFSPLFNSASWSKPYFLMIITGCSFWLLCLGAGLIVFYFIKNTTAEKLHATLKFYFSLNITVTFIELLLIMWDAGSFNPYTYQGMNQKYFIGTGDLLRGITFDVSTTNAIINAFATLYFLSRKNWIGLLLSMTALLLVASNLTTILLLLVLVFMFIFQSDRHQKSMIAVCGCLFIIFLARVSPQNQHYLKYIYQKVADRKIDTIPPDVGKPSLVSYPDSSLSEEDRRKKKAMLYLDSIKNLRTSPTEVAGTTIEQKPGTEILIKKPLLPKANIHTEPYQRKRDTTNQQRQLIDYAVNHIPTFDTSIQSTQKENLPGKLQAFQQTLQYLKAHPFMFFTGTGTGQFASKLAFRTTGMRIAGGYPQQYAYINPAFRDNHLKIYLTYFSKDMEVHSIANSPDSVYDQLIAEYGLIGLAGFVFLYLAYFLRCLKRNSFAIPILLFTMGIFFYGYWFEQLSVIILFEALLLLNRKENNCL